MAPQLQFQISKLLSNSDITEKFTFPAKILKHIPIPKGIHFVDLQIMDSTEQLWALRYYTRPIGKRACPVFTKGWRQFARAKRLQTGDKLAFYGHQVRSADGELKIQYMIQVTRPSNVTYQGEPVYLDVECFL